MIPRSFLDGITVSLQVYNALPTQSVPGWDVEPDTQSVCGDQGAIPH